MSKNQKQQNKTEARQASIQFTGIGWEDYTHWQQCDLKTLASITKLINEILRNPFKGIGKPEPLKGDLTGYWSRRIDKAHRLVYFYEADTLTIISCRFHYG